MLPLTIDYPPMEAQLTEKLPEGDGWMYEPKWDGFRCIAFREGEKITLQSKSNKDLTRYFPELVENLLKLKNEKFILDGEIVIPVEGPEGFSFDILLQRIHPAASRVKKLAQETPCIYIVFDLLCDTAGTDLSARPLSERREALEHFAAEYLESDSGVMLSPSTTDPSITINWRETMGRKLDGIMAKRASMPYQSGNRTGMVKVKTMRSADCVIGGFRYASGSTKALGSILLGLYNEQGELNHVGFSSAFNAKEKIEMLNRLAPYLGPDGFSGSKPGTPSRWSTERSAEWVPLKPELVVEIKYDHFTNGRFRHGTSILRWRPDKDPRQCTYDQLR